jgi:ubiquinone/menaquinone biosynthesis C-methylase UbiE
MEVIRGRLPEPHEREYQEMMHYQGDQAETDAAATPGESDEPWENVIRLHEPVSHHALEWITRHPELGKAVRGRVLDIAAGSCWLTALVSKLKAVEGVWALDLSERFLTETGLRIVRRLGGEEDKIRLAVSDFNHMPFEDAFFDCGFLFSALHHSLAPVKLLREAVRCIRPGGSLFILESPSSVLNIAGKRRRSLQMSSRAVTEIAYTKAETEYLVRLACVPVAKARGAGCALHRLPSPNPRMLKETIKSVLRFFGLEDALKPPTYVIQMIPAGEAERAAT